MNNRSLADRFIGPESDIASTFPVIGTVLEAYRAHRRKSVDYSLAVFISAAELDEEYLRKLSSPVDQELLMEYLQSVGQTPSHLVCATLALIYRDSKLSPSIKSICAQALKGINLASLEALTKCVETIKDLNKMPNHFKPNGFDWGAGIKVSYAQLGYSEMECHAFVSDLKRRGICSPGGTVDTIGDDGALAVNGLTLAIYHHLQRAQELLND